ncbi:hypothetical protein [Calycomorphotria hydatis]|uniref:Uncharacterized protein n=1 Tax=Calycomorphotria hydatis TaxID=2528027 RepID=A0A517T3X7_9PLAN|nr:hypothetical protein [Calycomorphotria hydatis]QDT63083.1 hypothetical protein V22_02830 [Calycomorphotria hydatis]
MANGFAGAQVMNDRRRRRLATEDVDTTSPEETSAGTLEKRDLPEGRLPSHFPLRRIISRKQWKTALIVMSLATFCGGLCWALLSLDEVSQTAGRITVDFLQPTTSPFLSGVMGMLLVCCGGMAALIGWMRDRSPSDFRGSYRQWIRAGLFLFAVGSGMILGVDRLIVRLLSQTSLSAEQIKLAVTSFMIISGLIVCGPLRRELCMNRMSALAMSSTLLAWVASASLLGWCLYHPEITETAQRLATCSALWGCTLLAITCVVHLPYVLYVSVDAPRQKPVKKWNFRISLPKLKLPKLKLPKRTPRPAKASKPTKAEPVKPAARVEKKTAAPKSAPKPAPPKVAQPELIDFNGRKLDLSLPEEELVKGMSKRERRRFRQLLRERTAA